MLRLESLTKRYKNGHTAVRDVDLDLEPGVLGLVGPNGAGKTSLMQMIATITKPTAGRILFKGEDIARKPDGLRNALGYLPQDFGVYDNLTAREFLRYLAAMKGITDRAKIDEMLERVNLHGVAKRRVGGFSGGMRQRLGIAQALINDPEVLVVDEPTAGLDPEERVRFRNIMSEIGFGKLVIFSTHITSDIESIATRIAVMYEGRILTCDTPENLMQRAKGAVWSMTVPSEQYERLRAQWQISTVIRRAEGVQIRIVGGTRPSDDAVSAEPSLEDAFLHVMREAA
ncbi:MAG TPA: ABC transporter ATP-binding protein [Thermoanaerobaculia bacterium]|nr:ABC transporter ATP-binding protein [Thermoanaerobaculia bacterium]